jgi:hypothetical protein
MRFSSSIDISTPIYEADEKGRFAVPFAILPLFLFPLDVQIHRTTDNYKTEHDGQYRFQFHKITSYLTANQFVYQKSHGIREETNAQKYGQWDAFLLCRLCIDTGGKQSNKENDRKRVQAKAKAHRRRKLNVAASNTSKFGGKEKQVQSRQQKSDNPLK